MTNNRGNSVQSESSPVTESRMDLPPADQDFEYHDTLFITPRNTRMRRILDRARQISYEPLPILIQGERGSGKTLLARMIHHWGSRISDAPLVTLSCADVTSEKILRAIKHATARSGRGTIVLDAVEKLPADFLNELTDLILRRSQTFMDLPLASDKSPVRLVAVSRNPIETALNVSIASNQDRIKAMTTLLCIPPLRERREDIMVMAQRFLSHYAQEDHKPGLTFTAQARLALTSYDWPGNIRELRSIVERSAVVAPNLEVDVPDLALPQSGNGHALWPQGYPSLDSLERMYVLRVIRESPTLEEAARVLKVDISTLWRKRRRYGI